MNNYSDYIIFVDESGDHGLKNIDSQFPVFALSFCIFNKAEYVTKIVPALQKLKFEYWGHDAIVFHEHELRKSKGDYAFLRSDKGLRNQFFGKLSELLDSTTFQIIASVINKERLIAKYAKPWSPYELALTFCMERTLEYILDEKQEEKIIHVILESRGKKEDRELELVFRRICDNDQTLWPTHKRRDYWPNFSKVRFEPRFLTKAANSTGLQIADLTARPLALKALRPDQQNRTYDILAKKLAANKYFP